MVDIPVALKRPLVFGDAEQIAAVRKYERDLLADMQQKAIDEHERRGFSLSPGAGESWYLVEVEVTGTRIYRVKASDENEAEELVITDGLGEVVDEDIEEHDWASSSRKEYARTA